MMSLGQLGKIWFSVAYSLYKKGYLSFLFEGHRDKEVIFKGGP